MLEEGGEGGSKRTTPVSYDHMGTKRSHRTQGAPTFLLFHQTGRGSKRIHRLEDSVTQGQQAASRRRHVTVRTACPLSQEACRPKDSCAPRG